MDYHSALDNVREDRLANLDTLDELKKLMIEARKTVSLLTARFGPFSPIVISAVSEYIERRTSYVQLKEAVLEIVFKLDKLEDSLLTRLE